MSPEESGDHTIDEPETLDEYQEYVQHATDQDWPHWYVIVHLNCRDGEQIFNEIAPHRAAAKQMLQHRLDDEAWVTEWVETYIPRPSWDCPECGTHEALTEIENLRGDHDWECMVCGLRAYGEPMDWDRLDRSFVTDRPLVGTPAGGSSDPPGEQIELDECQ